MPPEFHDPASVNRRDFLKAAGLAATVGVAAPALDALAQQAKESRADRRKARYQETDHVKQFYALNRL